MGNIIDYIKEYGNNTFLEKVFNSVDSLVLSELSYLKFDDCVSGVDEIQKKITLRQINELSDTQYDALFEGLLDVKSNMQLLKEAAGSKRFGNTQMVYYENLVEPEKETQFAAMIFLLEECCPFIAFRGTDETLIGWKEDFNMAFLSPVPAQERAVEYMTKITPALPQKGKFYMGGHSKGGNVAVYAAMHMKEDMQKRIRRIYSLDGPGFKEDFLEDEGYLKIAHRIKKIIPQSSIIGMLLENQEEYQVIRSSQNGILQHDPFSWIVKRGNFQYLKEVDRAAYLMDKTLNEWIQNMDDAAREKLVNIIFDIIHTSQMTDATEVIADWKKVFRQIMEATREQDEETRKILWKMLKQFMRMGAKQLLTINENKDKINQKVIDS